MKKRDHIINQKNIEITNDAEKFNFMSTNNQTLENVILELKEEKIMIQEQLKSGDDSARVLDEYKKRAQMALKKVKFR